MEMRFVLYYGYMLTGMAYNAKPGLWRPFVRVSGGRQEEELTLQDRISFSSEREAEEHAIGLGKHWVNNRLQTEMF
jgi:hypothetical protein